MALVAVFWDRDKTLIEDPGYISDPGQVKLRPGAGEALRRLADAGFENIIATNQSGIARGRLDEPMLERIHERLRELLAAEGAKVDAIYYCPYLAGEAAVVEAYRQESDLRKPRPGMLVKASLERNLDLSGSWSIGDALRDAQAGRAAGCRTILLLDGDAAQPARHRDVDFVARSLREAADLVLKHTRLSGDPAGPSPSPRDATAVLDEILQFLRMADRRSHSEDFSLARLTGAVVQIFALAALIWAIFGMIQSPPYGPPLVRLMFTLTLQLIALTLFMLSSKK